MALLVLLAGLGATLYYWQNLRSSLSNDIEAAYERQVTMIGTISNSRMQLYENLLRSSSGLFTIHSGTTQADWDSFHQPYNIDQKYPDIIGIGLNRYLKEDDLPSFMERRQGQGEADFKITPEGDRGAYAPILFTTRHDNKDAMPRGFDSYSDPVRRKAMDIALETGKPAMTGVVRLERDGQQRDAFILYSPVYLNGQASSTPDERRKNVLGFAFVAVDMKMFLDTVVKGSQSPHVAVGVRDEGAETQVYRSVNYQAVHDTKGMQSNTGAATMYGHTWYITLASSPQILSSRERELPDQALWRGLLTCAFFAGLVWYLITDRERKYARQKQQEVQTAKDDLLSLASHQLRTPATVVKQYVGMLLQGYGGKLTPQQLGMLTNAYDSNERQLEIINQLLYVARLDAGRIKLHKQDHNIVKVFRDVARDQTEALNLRHHKITYALPKRQVIIPIDQHYIRMVLENLLTNAIKYTPEGGTISLRLSSTDDIVRIEVSDTGVGISESVRDSIFEKFTRVENELSTDVNGSGVGLYLTQQIVTLHGGTISVESAEGEGSTFIVELPRKHAGPAEATPDVQQV